MQISMAKLGRWIKYSVEHLQLWLLLLASMLNLDYRELGKLAENSSLFLSPEASV